MILAAGRGERMRPLTDTVPKPLLEAGGRSLIARHVDALVGAGIRDIVINHAWLGARIEAALGDGADFGARIRYSPEASALETAGGIATALPLLGDDPFVVVNGDIFCDFDFRRMARIIARMRAADLLAWCVLVPNPAHNRAGDFGIDGDRLLAQAPEQLTFAGIGAYSPALFAGIAPGTRARLAPLLREAADRGRAGAEIHAGRWTDVGTPQRLAELDLELRAQ
ncbi:MAG: nucleotidyltransferase family protein [Burkholderiaceae bacterium]